MPLKKLVIAVIVALAAAAGLVYYISSTPIEVEREVVYGPGRYHDVKEWPEISLEFYGDASVYRVGDVIRLPGGYEVVVKSVEVVDTLKYSFERPGLIRRTVVSSESVEVEGYGKGVFLVVDVVYRRTKAEELPVYKATFDPEKAGTPLDPIAEAVGSLIVPFIIFSRPDGGEIEVRPDRIFLVASFQDKWVWPYIPPTPTRSQLQSTPPKLIGEAPIYIPLAGNLSSGWEHNLTLVFVAPKGEKVELVLTLYSYCSPGIEHPICEMPGIPIARIQVTNS